MDHRALSRRLAALLLALPFLLHARPVPERTAPMQPPASFFGPGLDQTLRLLRAAGSDSTRITLGRYEPRWVVLAGGGSWSLHPLVVDERIPPPSGPTNVPEMHWERLVPGEAILRDSTLEGFARRLSSWKGWDAP